MRIRRSLGWAKGFSVESVKKIINTECDAVCIDLEDGVPAIRKTEARATTVKMIQELDFKGKERIVRINPFGSQYFQDDINEVIAVAPPDAIRVPKCEHVNIIEKIDTLLSAIEKKHNLPENSIEIIAMIESPIGVRNAYDIACSCKRLTALNIGMEDLTREMGIERRYYNNPLDLIYARQKVVLDSKAAGVQCIDSGLLIEDFEANHKQNIDSKQMGFTGRSVHNNAEAISANEAFSPSKQQIAFSTGAVQAWEMGNSTKDNIVFDGRTICFAAYEKNMKKI